MIKLLYGLSPVVPEKRFSVVVINPKNNPRFHLDPFHFYQQLDLKEAEILRLESHMHTLQRDVTDLKSTIDQSKAMQSRQWENMSRAADSLRIGDS